MLAKIETKKLGLCYGEKRVLENISLSFPNGKVSAILGPSGCGKSTFLAALNRLHDLDASVRIEGNVFLDGKNIYAPQIDVLALRKTVGLIFQKPNPFPFSIQENISFALKQHGIPKRELPKRVETALQEAGLWEEVKDRLSHLATTLSGGQQQRLCIARAIALRPEVLLMDEPCASLDPLSTAKIEELIQNLRGEYTFVIVTHNLSQARRISQYSACFWAEKGIGILAEQANTEELFENPCCKEVQDYIQGRAG